MFAPLALVIALASAPLDSQAVLERYAARLLVEEPPKTLIFTYTVSQAGPHDIEQTHRIYRSGDLVRDETLAVDGQAVKPKITRIARYRNRYTILDLAPRLTQYAFLFQRSIRSAAGFSYLYRAVPLGATGQFVVDGMTIDDRTYSAFRNSFSHDGRGGERARARSRFGRSGKNWIPTTVNVSAKIAGKPARERISFSAYQFPASLPKSIFQPPKPLPEPAPTAQ